MNIATRVRLAMQVLWGIPLTGEGETTSPQVASVASKGLAHPMSLSAQEIRTVCASALTQAPKR